MMKNKIYHGFKQFPTLIIIINVSWSSDPHIRVICEGSCDTEDWSNDAEDHRNKLHFTVYSHREQMIYTIIIFHNLYCIFNQISRRENVSKTS